MRERGREREKEKEKDRKKEAGREGWRGQRERALIVHRPDDISLILWCADWRMQGDAKVPGALSAGQQRDRDSDGMEAGMDNRDINATPIGHDSRGTARLMGLRGHVLLPESAVSPSGAGAALPSPRLSLKSSRTGHEINQ